MLPKVLPRYEIPIQHYFVGYSLWVVLGVVALVQGLHALWRRVFAAKVVPAVEAAPSPIAPSDP